MNIELPKQFSYEATSESGYGYAHVDERNVLIIKGNVCFQKLMYVISYELKNTDYCYYCGLPLGNKKITLDHMYPRDRGGPTIPENLIPCCSDCNEQKGNMNEAEYAEFKKLGTDEERRNYRNALEKYWEKVKTQNGRDIPEEWLINPNKVDILVTINFREDCKRSKKYQKVKKMYREYHKLTYPVIIDRNNVLLDGFYTLMYSKKNEIFDVPLIRLDNVEKKI